LEEKYNVMEQEFNNSYEGNTIPVELIDKGRQIWNEFSQKKREILREYCTEKISEIPRVGGHMGEPTQFYFIEKEHDLQFIMKTEKKLLLKLAMKNGKVLVLVNNLFFLQQKTAGKSIV